MIANGLTAAEGVRAKGSAGPGHAVQQGVIELAKWGSHGPVVF
jgi:hypothetical protein